MKIKYIEGLTTEQINRELSYGAKFVLFQYTISIIVLTFRRSSDVYFIRPGESRLVPGIKYSLLTFVMGWWGILWGPIYSIGSLFTNFSGGKDVSQEILAAVNAEALPAA